jgi:hypothetical protein
MRLLKFTLLSFLIAGVFFVTGCKKCATCTQTIITTVNVNTPGYPQTTKSTFEACGNDLKAVDGQTTTSTSSAGGITATATSNTVCN